MNQFGKPCAATLALSALALSTGLATPAGAATTATSSTSCRGVAVSIAGTTFGDANPQRTPCAADSQAVVDKNVSLLLGGITLQALRSVTTLTNGAQGSVRETAAATVASLGVNLLGLNLVQATGLKAGTGTLANAACTVAHSIGGSTLGAITVLGQTIPLDGGKSVTVKLPLGLGAVYVNQQVATATSIVQRALFIDLPGTFLDVIIAQATTGCASATSAGVESMAIKQNAPSKALVRSVRARIERLRDEPQHSALPVEQAGH
ncbi:MAG TPA: choice-of-anchor P family protein [Sporichthyaceae bacterium]|nr:choice-of-anchor P family protein [Sporichthyaceae bacterium]